MVNIQVRNVPTEVHAVLKRRAETAGQSLQEYVSALLATHASQKTVAEVFEEVRAYKEAHPEAFRSTTEELTAIIRHDRESR